ncbi:MAG: BCD family MFS transporter [Candidatus Promineifilaceae bacterium]|nr:BCD family MFS transporter [Candidatus Promineifilaceae bacterium]
MNANQYSLEVHFFRRTIRLSSFQIGSAMGDILVTSIWNRIMISNFGIPAAPVSLLIALRYFLAPISLWAGYLSDTKPFGGLRRTPYIWFGRALMLISLPLLGLSLVRLGADQQDFLGWAVATLSSLLYGVGTLVSGSPFVTLVRDSAPPEKQGLAISTVQTVLIIFFAVFGIIFGLWMKVYDQKIFWQMIVATMSIGGFFWFLAIVGVEKHVNEMTVAHSRASDALAGFMPTLRKIWADPRTRGFFIFLSLSTMSAWMQDAILEPFGADVYSFPAGRTTRFNSYWQVATVIFLVGAGVIWRKRSPERQVRPTAAGLVTMAAGMVLLAYASLTHTAYLVEGALLVFGAGFGIFTFGGLSLMAAMSSEREAGAYLGLWTFSNLLFKGLGIFIGGAMRDLFLLQVGLPASTSYALVFTLSTIGLLAAVITLTRVDVLGFARDVGRVVSRTEAQIAGAD